MKNLVCFHIGRGGRFNNQGHKTYRSDIESFQELLDYYANDLFEYTEDEEGNPLPDEECCIKGRDGIVLVQGREAMESETGILDFDGDYNTTYAKELKDCTDEELQTIVDTYNSLNYVDDDILDFACDKLGYMHIYSVKGYPSNIDVITNEDAPYPCNWENRDYWEGCTWDDFAEFMRDELHVLKYDEYKLLTNPYIDEWLTNDEENND